MKIQILILLLLVTDIGIQGVSATRYEEELLKPTRSYYSYESKPPVKKEESKSFFGFSIDGASIVEGLLGGDIRGSIRISDFSFNFAINPWKVYDFFTRDDEDDDYYKKQKKSNYYY